MNDTDKLIAAIFAATLTARQTDPGPSDFFAFYDVCIAEIIARDTTDAIAKSEQKLAAQMKGWG